MENVFRFLKVSLTLFTIMQLSCKTNESIDIKSIFEKASKSDSLAYYYPSILNDTIEVRNPIYKDFEQKWYSTSLYSFKEPILYTKSDTHVIYRILLLRSFDEPVCFTMKEFKGSYFLNAKTLDRQPAFYPKIESKGKDKNGKWILDSTQKGDHFALIDFDTIKALTTGQWNEIESFISKLDFWKSPVSDPKEEDSTDGSSWILEGRKNGTYHFIKRSNPVGDLKDFGKKLNHWSGLNIKDNSFY